MFDHTIEIGAVVLAPGGVNIADPEFSSLCHTSRKICAYGLLHFETCIYMNISDSIKTVWYKSSSSS